MTLKQVSVETGILESDLHISKNGHVFVVCPECNRRRLASMAFFTPCPGPFDHKTARSAENCNNIYFMRSDLKEQYKSKQESKLEKLREWVKNKKGGEKMNFLKKKSNMAPTVAKAVANNTPAVQKKATIKSQILDAHKSGVEYDAIAKQVERSRAYVVSTISKSKK